MEYNGWAQLPSPFNLFVVLWRLIAWIFGKVTIAKSFKLHLIMIDRFPHVFEAGQPVLLVKVNSAK